MTLKDLELSYLEKQDKLWDERGETEGKIWVLKGMTLHGRKTS